MFDKNLLKRLKILAYILLWLIVLDVAMNLAFKYPSDGVTKPNAFQEYFDYGRSIEGKINRMITIIEKLNAPIAVGGWLDTARLRDIPIKGPAQGRLISVYGMSFAENLAAALVDCGSARIRDVTAGGAPPNWTFATYSMDRKIVHSDVAIFTIMTLGIPYISSTAGMTAFFEHPYPYTYPLYALAGDSLIAKYPPFLTREQFRRCFRDPVDWHSYRTWLSENDKYSSNILFSGGLTDQSLIVRALRRAYFRTINEPITKHIYDKRSFNESASEVTILRAFIRSFSRMARADGVLPFVYIVNNQSCGDDLFRLVEPVLRDEHIPFLSSHKIAPPDDPTSFGAATHFSIKKDHEMAIEVLKIIDNKFNRQNIAKNELVVK